jgi:transposase-like protein
MANGDSRKIRGLAILARGNQIKRLDRTTYRVKSQNGNGSYLVIKDGKEWRCECPDYQFRKAECKHIHAVRFSQELRDKVTSENLELGIEERPDTCVYCESHDIVKRGIRRNKRGDVQRYMCKTCGRRFVVDNGFAKMRNSPKAITSAMDLYFKGVSLRKISDHLKQFYGIKVHYSTVLRWIRKYINVVREYTDGLTPELSPVWHADEMMVKINGTGFNGGRYNYQWLWNLMDEDTRFLLATKIARKREIKDARELFKESKKIAKAKPKYVVTDGLQAYHKAFNKEFYDHHRSVKHIRLSSLRDKPNNNLIERLHGSIREREKVMRAMDNPASAQALMDRYRVYYNFIRPHMALGGLTPAEVANINLRLEENKWLDLIKKITNDKKVSEGEM